LECVAVGTSFCCLRCKEREGICQYYFNRYDLDESGFIDSADELTSLTINLINVNKVQLNVKEVDAATGPVVIRIENGERLTLQDFMCWFYVEIIVREEKKDTSSLFP